MEIVVSAVIAILGIVVGVLIGRDTNKDISERASEIHQNAAKEAKENEEVIIETNSLDDNIDAGNEYLSGRKSKSDQEDHR